jgi:hypothetical protein
MTNITLAIPDEIHTQMRHHTEIRWSEVARRAIVEKLETLRQAEAIAEKSRLTPKDARTLDRKVKSAATKRFLHETRS